MPNNLIGVRNRWGAPITQWYVNGKSLTDLAGEPAALSTHSSVITASSGPGVRHILAADIAASYLQGGVIGGVLGFFAVPAVTNASGIANSPEVPSGKLATKEPIQPLPSFGYGSPIDAQTGYTMVPIYLALAGQQFLYKLGGGGVTTADNDLIGVPCGIDLAAGVYTMDTSESVKPFQIVDWEESAPSYVWVELLPAYRQYEFGVAYTSQ